MEEKIVVAVSGFPEIYDTMSYIYRDRNKKELAWRKISEEVGIPGKLYKIYIRCLLDYRFSINQVSSTAGLTADNG